MPEGYIFQDQLLPRKKRFPKCAEEKFDNLFHNVKLSKTMIIRKFQSGWNKEEAQEAIPPVLIL
jgi:hypothetical protein